MIPFAEWRPDMPALGQWAREAMNVVPAEESYRPLNELAGVSSALAARAQGAAWFRGTAGATKMFAGDATKLYLLSGSTWNDVSRTSGGPMRRAATICGASRSSARSRSPSTASMRRRSSTSASAPIGWRWAVRRRSARSSRRFATSC